jgi:hypothetical protein
MVVLVVFPPLALVSVRFWELYSVNRGTRLGVEAPIAFVVHEIVAVAGPVELEMLELELDEVGPSVEDTDEVLEELDLGADEAVEEEAEEDEEPPDKAKKAAAPPMTTTTITTEAMTALEMPRPRVVINNDLVAHMDKYKGKAFGNWWLAFGTLDVDDWRSSPD